MDKTLAVILTVLAAWGALANIFPDAFVVRGDSRLMEFFWGANSKWVALAIAGVALGVYFWTFEDRFAQRIRTGLAPIVASEVVERLASPLSSQEIETRVRSWLERTTFPVQKVAVGPDRDFHYVLRSDDPYRTNVFKDKAHDAVILDAIIDFSAADREALEKLTPYERLTFSLSFQRELIRYATNFDLRLPQGFRVMEPIVVTRATSGFEFMKRVDANVGAQRLGVILLTEHLSKEHLLKRSTNPGGTAQK
jgi:hypothetical protein